jgi:RND family efflux transporter MFP subunit
MTTDTVFSRKNLIIFVVTAIISAGAYFAWKWFHGNQGPEESVQQDANVEVVPIIVKTLFREDQLPAEIDAYQDVLIYPKVPGFVKWIGVDRGSVVKQGELMATMYAPEYISRRNEALSQVAAAKAALASEESGLQDIQAELKKSQANLLADQSTYQRVNAASMVPGVIADNDVVQWAQTVEVDREDVNTLIKRVNARDHEVAMRREELNAKKQAYANFADFASYLEIRAPFNGYITERRLHVGSYVGPNGSGAYPPICRIKQLDLLRIVSPVPERDTAGVVVGSEVLFSVSAFPSQKFIGRVARISNNLDKATRTMPVELNYFNPDYKILPGMFCEVYWPTRRRESSMFVPISAVVTTPLETFVCKIKDGVVDWVSVTKGQIMDGMVEVFGDLREGDMVAKQASEQLQDESRVKAVPPKPIAGTRTEG